MKSILLSIKPVNKGSWSIKNSFNRANLAKSCGIGPTRIKRAKDQFSFSIKKPKKLLLLEVNFLR